METSKTHFHEEPYWPEDSKIEWLVTGYIEHHEDHDTLVVEEATMAHYYGLADEFVTEYGSDFKDLFCERLMEEAVEKARQEHPQ